MLYIYKIHISSYFVLNTCSIYLKSLVRQLLCQKIATFTTCWLCLQTHATPLYCPTRRLAFLASVARLSDPVTAHISVNPMLPYAATGNFWKINIRSYV